MQMEARIEPGTLIDRYGYDGGTFASPKGIPYTERSLPLGTDKKAYCLEEENDNWHVYYSERGIKTSIYK